jgi:hypothetical protein
MQALVASGFRALSSFSPKFVLEGTAPKKLASSHISKLINRVPFPHMIHPCRPIREWNPINLQIWEEDCSGEPTSFVYGRNDSRFREGSSCACWQAFAKARLNFLAALASGFLCSEAPCVWFRGLRRLGLPPTALVFRLRLRLFGSRFSCACLLFVRLRNGI